jgi:UPF0755 protein
MLRRPLLAVLTGALIIATAVGADFYAFIHAPVALQQEALHYEIVPGRSFKRLARDLHEQGVISRPLYWTVLAKLTHRADKIKAGEYRIEIPFTPAQLLAHFVAGKTVQFSLTVPEGWTYRQLRAALAEHSKVTQTLGKGDDVMAGLGAPGMDPEGWFYPDTYLFPKGVSDREVLRRGYEAMQHRLEEAWAGREQGLPLKTPYEALILASIVEKETAAPQERPEIASVFISRLRQGMRLQTDPTVIYGLGEDYDGDIRYRDLKRNTPYNTYVHKGLPPTPIALPGGAALDAVLHPAPSRALYFVAKGDGRHHFSETYEQHRKAVIRFQLGGNGRRYRASGQGR